MTLHLTQTAQTVYVTVAIIGLGYVGLPLARLAARKRYRVFGIDIDSKKVNAINCRKLGFEASTSFEKVKKANIIIICVPTPVYPNRLPNYEPLENACKSTAPHLTKNDLVILESTVNPGVCENVVLPILGNKILLAHCPERINPGDKKWEVHNIPRVLGGLNKKSTEAAYKFYKSILSADIKLMGSLKEAEAVKVVENSFRNINIAFVNELAQSFARLGIDVVNVINGASTKPFSFMAHYPGCGVGGHCIPVDPYYLIDYAKKNGYSHKFLSLAMKINEDMPGYTVSLLKDEFTKFGKKFKGAKIAVLGLSYKADIADTRESPSFAIIDTLRGSGVDVHAYDPYVKNGSCIKNLDDAITGVDAVILATDHEEFKAINPSLLSKKKVKIIIDGRNFLNKDEFAATDISYKGIGR